MQAAHTLTGNHGFICFLRRNIQRFVKWVYAKLSARWLGYVFQNNASAFQGACIFQEALGRNVIENIDQLAAFLGISLTVRYGDFWRHVSQD